MTVQNLEPRGDPSGGHLFIRRTFACVTITQMGEFAKKLAWFVVLCAIAYGLFVFYVDWWNTPASAPTKQAVEKFIARTTGDAKQRVEQKAKEYTSEVVGEVKQSALDVVKEQVSHALTGIGEGIMRSAESLIGASSTPLTPITASSLAPNAGGTLPVPKGGEYDTPAPPVTLITRVDAPLVFSINRGTAYEIVWGDGERATGTVAGEVVRLVSHAWKTEGDFTAVVSVRGAGVLQSDSYHIRVYP